MVHKDFHAYEGHMMTEEQFSKCMTKYRRNTKFGQNQKDSKQHLDTRNVRASEEDFIATNKMVTSNIFAGRKTITQKEYNSIRKDIQEELWHYDFCQYECDE
jgi:hypothetical protein